MHRLEHALRAHGQRFPSLGTVEEPAGSKRVSKGTRCAAGNGGVAEHGAAQFAEGGAALKGAFFELREHAAVVGDYPAHVLVAAGEAEAQRGAVCTGAVQDPVVRDPQPPAEGSGARAAEDEHASGLAGGHVELCAPVFEDLGGRGGPRDASPARGARRPARRPGASCAP